MSRRWRCVGLLRFAALLAPGCGDSPTGDATTRYFAVAYGEVRQDGTPLSGVEVNAEVFATGCPATGAPASGASTRSGVGGAYRLLLSSPSPAAGQCLRLTVAGAPGPVLRTLDDTPFRATSGSAVQDSVRIDLTVP